MEIEEENGQEFEKKNSEGNLSPTDLKVGQLLARMFLPVLQGLPLILNPPSKDSPSMKLSSR